MVSFQTPGIAADGASVAVALEGLAAHLRPSSGVQAGMVAAHDGTLISGDLIHHPIDEFNKRSDVIEVVAPNAVSGLFPGISLLRDHDVQV